jgi:uncharacterized protein (TIGR00369 family)
MEIEEGLETLVHRLVKSTGQTLLDSLGIEFTKVTRAELLAEMPVNEKTRQPLGFLHGGASVALAETLASVGGLLNVDPEEFAVFGLEINANHVRSIREAYVIGTAKPIHVGKSTQVWEVRIKDPDDNLISISRCTLAVVKR